MHINITPELRTGDVVITDSKNGTGIVIRGTPYGDMIKFYDGAEIYFRDLNIELHKNHIMYVLRPNVVNSRVIWDDKTYTGLVYKDYELIYAENDNNAIEKMTSENTNGNNITKEVIKELYSVIY